MGIKHDVDTGKTTNKQTDRLVDIHLLFLFVIRQTRRHSHFTDLTFRFELPAQAHKRMEVARTKWDTFAPRHNLNQFPFDWFFFFFFPIHFIFLHFSMITNLRDLAQMTVFSIPLCQYERKTESNEQIKKKWSEYLIWCADDDQSYFNKYENDYTTSRAREQIWENAWNGNNRKKLIRNICRTNFPKKLIKITRNGTMFLLIWILVDKFCMSTL